MEPEPEPKTDWARHALRINDLIDNQVRSLRKRQVIDSFSNRSRSGTYWGIRTDIANYHIADALPCSHDKTMELARLHTRLKRVEDNIQEHLINWGYAVCDAAVRRHVDTTLKPGNFPFAGGVG